MESAFNGASNMIYNATDTPNLSDITSTSRMFSNARSFDGDLSGWDVSAVTNMSEMFTRTDAFDGNISGWDVSEVTEMNRMFRFATVFNQSLNGWDVSAVTNMREMFDGAVAFNGNISDWDVLAVTGMEYMFNRASAFNGNISGWNVLKVTTMSNMFNGATVFNQDISGWNVLNVTTMSNMFNGATVFNQDISGWNVSSVTNMDDMFTGADEFVQNLGNWYVTLDDTSIDRTTVPGAVGSISAQNSALGMHSPNYRINAGTDSGLFEITGNQLRMTSVITGRSSYTVNITAAGINVFESGNHWRVFQVTAPENRNPDGDFITTWRTGEDGQDVTIPVHSGLNYEYAVLWGDGTNSTGVTGNAAHTYAEAGDHQVRIYGTYPGIHLDGHDDASKLISIDQWGTNSWATMNSAFKGASNMVYGAIDVPNLSRVRDMSHMFAEAARFNGDISGWDVSKVTTMSNMFLSATSFDRPLNGWTVSKVTDMSSMFNGAASYNQTLNDWTVSKVTTMHSMFLGATSFDRPLNDWDVSAVITMRSMFFNADSFSQTLNDWDVLAVTDMRSMFADTSRFNGDISDWDVLEVTDMSHMFAEAARFNGDISGWDVSKVTTMSNMFLNATSFDRPLNNWNVSAVNDMSGMFAVATSFDRPLNNWDVSAVNDMSGMFRGASDFEQNLGVWYVQSNSASIDRTTVPVIVESILAQNTALDKHEPVYGIGNGADSNHFKITGGNQLNMTSVGTKSFYTANITVTGDDVFENGNNWRVFKITVIGSEDPTVDFVTTWRTTGNNQDVTIPVHPRFAYNYTVIWGDDASDTGVTGDAAHTYAEAGDHQVRIYGTYPRIFLNAHTDASKLISIDQWGSNRWTSMGSAFNGASSMVYNATDVPDLSGVTNMTNMFFTVPPNPSTATSSGWNVSKVTNMGYMFNGASVFHQSLNGWDVSSVTNMRSMFSQATAFNLPLNGWDVSKVTDMGLMFLRATSFEQSLNGWDVSSVTDMSSMFSEATSFFNQPLNGWDVSSVTDMSLHVLQGHTL